MAGDLAIERVLALAQGLIDAGRAETAYRLLRRAAIEASGNGADTAALRFLAARALLAGGHYSQAAHVLRRLAEDRPGLDRIILDYAEVLFVLGRDEESEEAFRGILAKDELPLPVRRNVEGFLERIRARQRLRYDFDVGFWHDDNVNHAPDDETVAIPALGGARFTVASQPMSAWVVRTRALLRWRETLTESGLTQMETRASIARNTALGASAHSRTAVRASTGPLMHYYMEIADRRYPGRLRANLGVERRWRGGKGYAADLRFGIGLEQSVARHWRVGGLGRLWVTGYDDGDDDTEPWGRSLDLYVARRIGPGWLTVGGYLSRETPERSNLRWTAHGTSVRYGANVGRDWSLSSFRSGLVRTGFDERASLFLVRRKERRFSTAPA